MQIRIVRRPDGEAPEWVRDAWIGLTLPLAAKRSHNFYVVGVLSGPHNFFAQIWKILTGRGRKVSAYLVNANAAVTSLAVSNPEAAQWWREHTPILLSGHHNFTFEIEACEPV